MFGKPIQHVRVSLFRTLHGMLIFFLVPYRPPMRDARKYLHMAVDLKANITIISCFLTITEVGSGCQVLYVCTITHSDT